ncbi:sensor histidine kinase [Allofournierella massiliensis]|uniref:sensor histidine kinase n=1 Tax=Allofournierella massiliensis TaxID=1650663 RepID=UPI0039A1BECA
MKKGSLIRQLAIMLTAQILLLIVVLLLVIAYTIHNARVEKEKMLSNLLTVYGQNLENRIQRADGILENITLNQSTELDLITSDKESERYYARVELFESMRAATTNDDTVEILLVAENRYYSALMTQNSTLRGQRKERLQEFALRLLEPNRQANCWRFARIGDTIYLYRAYCWNHRVIAAFISVQEFWKTDVNAEYEDLTWLLTDPSGYLWAMQGEKLPLKLGCTVKEEPAGAYLQDGITLADSAIRLYCCTKTDFVWDALQGNMIGLILILLVTITFALILVRYIYLQILSPMGQMVCVLQQIDPQEQDLSLHIPCKNREFSILQDAFNTLMQENIGLRFRSYERQIEVRNAELRAIRLQLKPHFFLNAITTISSLSMQGKNLDIRQYIDVLSKNIRYMFKSGMRTVPLSEELQNIEAYFEMQELKYPGAVFYCIQAQPPTQQWPIPHMLIHTVVENVYKYAVTVGGDICTVLISARLEQHGGQETMLCIEIEDDGPGYPEEFLERIRKQENSDLLREGKHIGLQSLAKMLELMYGRTDLMELENLEPHGAHSRFWIPQVATIKDEVATDAVE